MSAISNATQPAQAETPAERTARHMGMCRDLADTAMQLARQTAAKILTPQTAPAPLAPDPIQAFIRLATIIHKTIALECRIALGQSPRRSRAPQFAARSASARSASARSVSDSSVSDSPAFAGPSPQSCDRRREDLKIALDYTTEKRPDRAAIRRETYAQMDRKLAENPEAEIGEIFTTICDDLGIEIDYGRMPDRILNPLLPPGYVEPTEFDLPEGSQHDACPQLHLERR